MGVRVMGLGVRCGWVTSSRISGGFVVGSSIAECGGGVSSLSSLISKIVERCLGVLRTGWLPGAPPFADVRIGCRVCAGRYAEST